MIETAENLARDYAITRAESDAYAARSQQRAAAAWAQGKFAAEVVPVSLAQRKGDALVVDMDEGVRGETTPESLAKLKPIMKDGIVTAGNACQQNDAAAACLIVAEDKLQELRLEPSAWLVGWAAAGCEPSRMGMAPSPRCGSCSHVPVCAGTRWTSSRLMRRSPAKCWHASRRWTAHVRTRRPAERERLRHLARPSGRCNRGPHHDHAAARAAAASRALRA